ncbi:peptidoglycan recognition protein [Streptomyces sp. NPDC014894]|uniref:peptidoglycan recognition protein family protein n=1 Tax=Streptomyces sp. NPDC014894 TaxID=3364931 RepID=UPI0036F902F8
MRGYLATSIGVAVSTALVLPLSPPAGATAAALPPPPPPAVKASGLPGSTQSLPLTPTTRSLAPSAERGTLHRQVRPFSMAGVVWDDARAELHGAVQLRTRAIGTGVWSRWQDVETHNHEHGADLGTAENAGARGSTAPLWVGASDGVEVRVRPEAGRPAALPAGMRLELVDPGEAPEEADEPEEPEEAEEPDEPEEPEHEIAAAAAAARRAAVPAPDALPARQAAKPYIGPRPKIVSRKGWKASESLRERGFVYSSTVKAAFVHHSATGNGYTCKQSASVLRSIYRYHVVSSGWRDIGYNFAVDKCGKIYEGRAGGVTRAVRGAHTLGFNTNSMGIAVLGSFSRTGPPAAAVTAVARLTAWKLGLFKGNPKGKVTLTSGGSGKYAKGRKVRFNVISGHRDGFYTDCPGARLYSKLGLARKASAGYQGRA